MIDFTPGTHPELGEVLIVEIVAAATMERRALAVVSDATGRLHTVPADDLSIAFHYDAAKGRWKADFGDEEESP